MVGRVAGGRLSVPSMFFHSAGNLGPPQASLSQPMGFLKGWEWDLASKERQQQCPVLLWEGGVAAGIQEGFLEEAAMGLLTESELGG